MSVSGFGSSGRAVRVALLGLLCGQVLMSVALIPPWQGPDEPQHLMTVRMILAYGSDFTLDQTDSPTEQSIVASMAHYGWWEHYGRSTPNSLPPTFAEGPARVVGGYFGPPADGSRLYYRAMAMVFSGLGIEGLLPQLYAMRALSAVLSILLVLGVWAASRAAFDDRTALVISSALALHPQFIVGSVTAGPDAVVNLAAGIAWGAAVTLIRFPQTIRYAAVLWLAAVSAVMTRRLGAPLLLVVGGLTLWWLVRTLHAGRRQLWLATGGTVVVAMVLAGAAYPLLGDEIDRAVRWASFDPTASLETVQVKAAELPNFFNTLFQTFWLGAGWMRYLAAPRWHLVAGALTAMGLAGLFAWRRQEYRGAIVLSTSMVIVQLAAITAYHFGITQSGATGRYLFPVLSPILALLWFGWRAWFPDHRQALAAVSFITIMALLNITAWTLVVLPAYA